MLAALLVSATACERPTESGQDDVEAVQQLAPEGPRAPEASSRVTLLDVFGDMADRLPGGFAGVYFDADGVMNVALKEPGLASTAIQELASEPLIIERQEAYGRGALSLEQVRIVEVSWSYSELYGWYSEILEALDFAPRMSRIDVTDNRVVLGVSSDEHVRRIEDLVRDRSIPEDAVSAGVSAPIRLLNGNLHSKFQPVPSGVKVTTNKYSFLYDEYVSCTLGPNLLRHSPPHWGGTSPQEGFLLPSHCTLKPFDFGIGDPDPTKIWQPVNDIFSQPRIGEEGYDTIAFSCPENPTHGCRESDAALFMYGNDSPELGKIARTPGRNSGSLQIDGQTPRFHISQVMHYTLPGETLEKVGMTTGWTGGIVHDGCVTVTPQSSPSIRCSMIVEADAGGGDSGAPVFRILPGGNVELRGMLFGGMETSDPDGLGCAYDEICAFFAASNLGGIEHDLDPWYSLTYQWY